MNQKPKLFCFYSESHKLLFEKFFSKGELADYDLKPEFSENQFSKTGEYCKSGWRETQYNKVLFWIDCIKENMGDLIVCSDVDVQFLEKTFDYLSNFLSDSDIAFQSNDDKGQICSGFFICRCSLQTLNFFEIVAKRLSRIMNEDGGGEQYIIRDLLKEGWINLNIKKIPRDKVWCPGVKYNKETELSIPEGILVHHANWVEGVDEKIKQLNHVKYSIKNDLGVILDDCNFKNEKSEVAICMSSLIRNFDLTCENFIEKIIKVLPCKPDFFGHFPAQCKTEENLKLLNLIKKECLNYHVVFEEDYLDENYLSFHKNMSEYQRSGIEGNLLQWKSMEKSRDMKIAKEEKFKEKYSCVIWTRPDLYFFNSLDNVNNLLNYELYFPAHDNHFDGIFDRFCLGSSEKMDFRMSMYRYFTQVWYPKKHTDKKYLYFDNLTSEYKWNPELVLKALISESGNVNYGKLNLCCGKSRGADRVRVPFWSQIHGFDGLSRNKEFEEDIINQEVLRKIYSYEEIIPDEYGAWFEVVVR
jgi:hypothetical protein